MEEKIITHVSITEANEDRKKLFFYTKSPGQEVYFLRCSQTKIPLEVIKSAIANKKIIELKKPIIIKSTETLWLKSDGNLYIGEYTQDSELKYLYPYKIILS